MIQPFVRPAFKLVDIVAAVLVVSMLTFLPGCGREDSSANTGPASESGLLCPVFADASSGLPQDGEWRTLPAVGDVNGDGLADIAGIPRKGKGPRVFLSDGLGGWHAASEGLEWEGIFSCGIGTRLMDVNGDDFTDLLIADHCHGVKIYRGDGGASWKESSRGIPSNLQGFNDADAGDLNGDGILDIVAVSAYTHGFLVLLGRADGSFRIASETDLPTVGGAYQVELSDVNGDGLLDIVTGYKLGSGDLRRSPPPPAKVWIQEPGVKFRPAEGFTESGRFFGIATVARPDRPVPDILFCVVGAKAGIYRIESDSGEAWTEASRIDEGWFGGERTGYVGLDSADFNNDGCRDIVYAGGIKSKIWLALGNCRGQWTVCPEEIIPMEDPRSPGWGVTVGDFNGDGLLDLVAAYGSKGKGLLKAWYQTSAPGKPLSVDHGQGPAESSAERGSGSPVPEP
jgi:hypothetical protein